MKSQDEKEEEQKVLHSLLELQETFRPKKEKAAAAVADADAEHTLESRPEEGGDGSVTDSEEEDTRFDEISGPVPCDDDRKSKQRQGGHLVQLEKAEDVLSLPKDGSDDVTTVEPIELPRGAALLESDDDACNNSFLIFYSAATVAKQAKQATKEDNNATMEGRDDSNAGTAKQRADDEEGRTVSSLAALCPKDKGR